MIDPRSDMLPIIWANGRVRVRWIGPPPKFGLSVRFVNCGLSLLRLKAARFVSRGHLGAQGCGRTLRVILHSPGCNGGARFLQGATPVLMQALLP
jgi:hypothetical protein